jgi:exportin-2 (importin alpha re-exporter)
LKDLTTNAVQTVMSNPNAASEAIMLEVLMKLFYNLNYQDLHPKYEDTLEYWMNVLKAVMKLPNVN